VRREAVEPLVGDLSRWSLVQQSNGPERGSLTDPMLSSPRVSSLARRLVMPSRGQRCRASRLRPHHPKDLLQCHNAWSERIAETQRQRRSFKPNLPIEHPQSQHPCALDGFWHPPRQGQIPIARGAFPTSTPRGFLPWGLSDDGPSACPHCRELFYQRGEEKCD
jgi:hypothetical protein